MLSDTRLENDLYMTDDEIRRKFKRNGSTQSQIEIIAELNGCTKSRIMEVLGKKPKNRFDGELALHYYNLGYSDKDIAEKLGFSKSYICHWRLENGLAYKKKKNIA